jgi:hypothetical protein
MGGIQTRNASRSLASHCRLHPPCRSNQVQGHVLCELMKLCERTLRGRSARGRMELFPCLFSSMVSIHVVSLEGNIHRAGQYCYGEATSSVNSVKGGSHQTDAHRRDQCRSKAQDRPNAGPQIDNGSNPLVTLLSSLRSTTSQSHPILAFPTHQRLTAFFPTPLIDSVSRASIQ